MAMKTCAIRNSKYIFRIPDTEFVIPNPLFGICIWNSKYAIRNSKYATGPTK